MDTIKNFIKKYYIYIIIILLVLLMGKSCQSCTRKNNITYNKYQYNITIDSLKEINNTYKDSIMKLNTKVLLLTNELDGCKVENLQLKEEYNNIKNINNTIQKTNNKLINKLTENDEKH